MVLALIYRVLAAREVHEHTLLGGARRDTDAEGFGPLKVLLEEILTLFADGAVRNNGLLLGAAI